MKVEDARETLQKLVESLEEDGRPSSYAGAIRAHLLPALKGLSNEQDIGQEFFEKIKIKVGDLAFNTDGFEVLVGAATNLRKKIAMSGETVDTSHDARLLETIKQWQGFDFAPVRDNGLANTRY